MAADANENKSLSGEVDASFISKRVPLSFRAVFALVKIAISFESLTGVNCF